MQRNAASTDPSMRVLIAEDERVSRKLLANLVTKWGYEAVCAESGDETWKTLQAEQAPRLLILDWMMPGLDGIEICRRLRKQETDQHTHIIMLTVRDRKEDLIEGLSAGADDYITKPFDREELRVRLAVGRRVVRLEHSLAQRIHELQHALAKVKTLSGLIPMCAGCKKIRDDEGYWSEVEHYIMSHSEVELSHGLCPDCLKKHYPGYGEEALDSPDA